MKLGIFLIVLAAILFFGNAPFVLYGNLALSVFRTIVLPGLLVWWGITRIQNAKSKVQEMEDAN